MNLPGWTVAILLFAALASGASCRTTAERPTEEQPVTASDDKTANEQPEPDDESASSDGTVSDDESESSDESVSDDAPPFVDAPRKTAEETTEETTDSKFEPRNFSEPMTIEVTLRRAPCGAKGSKLAGETCTWLELDGGDRWLAVSDEDLSRFDGRRVRITGRTYDPSPYVAHLGAQHFEVQGIESGE